MKSLNSLIFLKCKIFFNKIIYKILVLNIFFWFLNYENLNIAVLFLLNFLNSMLYNCYTLYTILSHFIYTRCNILCSILFIFFIFLIYHKWANLLKMVDIEILLNFGNCFCRLQLEISLSYYVSWFLSMHYSVFL